MSAAEGQNGSAPSAESVDLAALRPSLRCGRSLPVRHLVESDEVVTQRRRRRGPVVLCCAEVAAPDPDADDPDCPGCRDCVRYCPDCVGAVYRGSAGESGDDPGHPAWCSLRHCYRIEEGDRVHQSVPARWEDCEVQFEITLVGPEDDDRTYVELRLASLMLTGQFFYVVMPVSAARRLRDELSAHLDAAAVRHRVARNGVAGVAGRVLMSSDLDVGGAPEHSGTTEADAEVLEPGGGSDSAS